MDIEFKPEEKLFREEVRDWLAQNVPPKPYPLDGEEAKAFDLAWQRKQYEGGFNMVKYCNPKVDELNAKAKRTFAEDARRELIIEATNIVNDELPVGVMHFSKANAGYSDRLQNFEPSSWGVDLNYVWVTE